MQRFGLLLLPCLLVDPSTAGGFHSPNAHSFLPSANISDQALAFATNFSHPKLSHGVVTQSRALLLIAFSLFSSGHLMQGQIRSEGEPLWFQDDAYVNHYDDYDGISQRQLRRIELERQARVRWGEFVEAKNIVLKQSALGNPDEADKRIAHWLHIALKDTLEYQEYTNQDGRYAQGALTLLALEGSPKDRRKALNALLQLARTDTEWSNHIADEPATLDALLTAMSGNDEQSWRAAAVLRSATIPDALITEDVVKKLLLIDLRRSKEIVELPSSLWLKAAEGVRNVFRWNVLNLEKGTVVALRILFDPKTPKEQVILLKSELVAAGNEFPMRQDPRARIEFAPGLKRLDDFRENAAKEKEKAVQKIKHEDYFLMFMWFFLIPLISTIPIWFEGLSSFFRKLRGRSVIFLLATLPWHPVPKRSIFPQAISAAA
jgi:hypothetical protein